jgi:hypothetical protein
MVGMFALFVSNEGLGLRADYRENSCLLYVPLTVSVQQSGETGVSIHDLSFHLSYIPTIYIPSRYL